MAVDEAFVYQTFGRVLASTPGSDLTIFRDIVSIVQPRRILETGFFRGGSAFTLLYVSDAHLTSIDPMGGADNSDANVQVVADLFPGRFTFIRKSSFDVRGDLAGQSFDLFNVDGDHRRPAVVNDLSLAVSLSIPWVILDDFAGDVRDAYQASFASEYVPVRVYARDDRVAEGPILRVLLCRASHPAAAGRCSLP